MKIQLNCDHDLFGCCQFDWMSTEWPSCSRIILSRITITWSAAIGAANDITWWSELKRHWGCVNHRKMNTECRCKAYERQTKRTDRWHTQTHRHRRPIRTNFSFLCLHSMRVNMNKFAFKCVRWVSGSNYYLYDYTAHRAPQHFIDNVMRFDIYNWINFIYKIVTTFVATYSKFGSRAPKSFLTCVVCCWRTTWTEHLCSA